MNEKKKVNKFHKRSISESGEVFLLKSLLFISSWKPYSYHEVQKAYWGNFDWKAYAVYNTVRQ